jgi:hypothetical protein
VSAALSAREAAIVAVLTDAVTAPRSPLPGIAETDAVAAFERWLARAPRANRAALRVALQLLDLSPLALGRGRRLRSLARSQRVEVLSTLERIPVVRRVTQALCAAVSVSYFGDSRVLAVLGYDAAARVARGRELRRVESRA